MAGWNWRIGSTYIQTYNPNRSAIGIICSNIYKQKYISRFVGLLVDLCVYLLLLSVKAFSLFFINLLSFSLFWRRTKIFWKKLSCLLSIYFHLYLFWRLNLLKAFSLFIVNLLTLFCVLTSYNKRERFQKSYEKYRYLYIGI